MSAADGVETKPRKKGLAECKRQREALLTQEELDTRPKQPPNSYMRFCKKMRHSRCDELKSIVSESNAAGIKLSQVQVLGRWWKALSQDEKKSYEDPDAVKQYVEDMKAWNNRVKARCRNVTSTAVSDGYMRFQEHMRSEYADDIRSILENDDQAAVAVYISRKWESMTHEERSPFQERYPAPVLKPAPKKKKRKKNVVVGAAAATKKRVMKPKVAARKDKAATDEFGITHNLVSEAAGSDEDALPEQGVTLGDLLGDY